MNGVMNGVMKTTMTWTRSTMVTGLIALLMLVSHGRLEARRHAAAGAGRVLDYQVVSISKNWVVTARETSGGKRVKFRLPPSVFRGKTFDADLGRARPGRRFTVRGARNVRLSGMVMKEPPPGMGNKRGGPSVSGSSGGGGSWEILSVDPGRWVVTARNKRSRKKAIFKVNARAFTGFRFRANIKGIRKGEGFSLLAPNNLPFGNCCELLELKN